MSSMSTTDFGFQYISNNRDLRDHVPNISNNRDSVPNISNNRDPVSNISNNRDPVPTHGQENNTIGDLGERHIRESSVLSLTNQISSNVGSSRPGRHTRDSSNIAVLPKCPNTEGINKSNIDLSKMPGRVDNNSNCSSSESDGAKCGMEELNELLEEPVEEVALGERGGRGERIGWELHEVSISRIPGYGFGIAVSGGMDNPHFTTGDPSIAISDVLPGGPAEGKLVINDRVVSANSVSLEGANYSTAVAILRESGDTAKLVIKRRVVVVTPTEPEDVMVSMCKMRRREDFGVILGCKIYVKEIVPGSIADKDGNIREGDMVHRINNTALGDITLKEARKLLEAAKDRVDLVVRRDWYSALTGDARNRNNSPSQGPQGDRNNVTVNPNLYVTLPRKAQVRPEQVPTPPDTFLTPPMSKDEFSEDLMAIYSNKARTLPIPDKENARPLPVVNQENIRTLPIADKEEVVENKPELKDKPLTKFLNQNDVLPPRNISFMKEGSVGIRLTGGNEVGIFVSEVQPGSPAHKEGLRPGDKINQVNGMDMAGVTREEAVLFLVSLKESVELVAQYCKQEYDRIVQLQQGDSFYIKVHFSCTEPEQDEMGFKRREVFHVVDTLHTGVVGSWQAIRMDPFLPSLVDTIGMPERGIITNKTRAEVKATEQFNSLKKELSANDDQSKGNFFKRRRSMRRTSSKKRSKSLGRDHWEDMVWSESASKFPAYERVTLRHSTGPRPVVIFGPISDIARERLLADFPSKFSSPMSDDVAILKMSMIRDVMDSTKHALVDVTPNAINQLNHAQLNPIVILLTADNKQVVKDCRGPRKSKISSKKALEQCGKLLKIWSHVMTAILKLNSDSWYKDLLDLIEKQQGSPMWVPEASPAEPCSDDFLFPMASGVNYASEAESDGEFCGEDSLSKYTSKLITADKFMQNNEDIAKQISDNNAELSNKDEVDYSMIKKNMSVTEIIKSANLQVPSPGRLVRSLSDQSLAPEPRPRLPTANYSPPPPLPANQNGKQIQNTNAAKIKGQGRYAFLTSLISRQNEMNDSVEDLPPPPLVPAAESAARADSNPVVVAAVVAEDGYQTGEESMYGAGEEMYETVKEDDGFISSTASSPQKKPPISLKKPEGFVYKDDGSMPSLEKIKGAKSAVERLFGSNPPGGNPAAKIKNANESENPKYSHIPPAISNNSSRYSEPPSEPTNQYQNPPVPTNNSSRYSEPPSEPTNHYQNPPVPANNSSRYSEPPSEPTSHYQNSGLQNGTSPNFQSIGVQEQFRHANYKPVPPPKAQVTRPPPPPKPKTKPKYVGIPIEPPRVPMAREPDDNYINLEEIYPSDSKSTRRTGLPDNSGQSTDKQEEANGFNYMNVYPKNPPTAPFNPNVPSNKPPHPTNGQIRPQNGQIKPQNPPPANPVVNGHHGIQNRPTFQEPQPPTGHLRPVDSNTRPHTGSLPGHYNANSNYARQERPNFRPPQPPNSHIRPPDGHSRPPNSPLPEIPNDQQNLPNRAPNGHAQPNTQYPNHQNRQGIYSGTNGIPANIPSIPNTQNPGSNGYSTYMNGQFKQNGQMRQQNGFARAPNGKDDADSSSIDSGHRSSPHTEISNNQKGRYGLPPMEENKGRYGLPHMDENKGRYGLPPADDNKGRYGLPPMDDKKGRYGQPPMDENKGRYGLPAMDESKGRYGLPPATDERSSPHSDNSNVHRYGPVGPHPQHEEPQQRQQQQHYKTLPSPRGESHPSKVQRTHSIGNPLEDGRSTGYGRERKNSIGNHLEDGRNPGYTRERKHSIGNGLDTNGYK